MAELCAPQPATVGVVALQGDFAAHARALERVGMHSVEVRRPDQVEGLDAVVLPGGESTALLKLMGAVAGWPEAFRALKQRRVPILGTCAGLILLAREVEPQQECLGLLDVTVQRNAYGRQVDSFEARGHWSHSEDSLEMVFIRAPRISRLGSKVEVLAEQNGEAALVRQGSTYGASFHPELNKDDAFFRWFRAHALERRGIGADDRASLRLWRTSD